MRLTNSSGVYVSNDASNPSAGFTQGTYTTDLYVNFSVTKNIGYNPLTSVTVDFVAIGLAFSYALNSNFQHQ